MKKFPNIKVKIEIEIEIENQGGGKPHYDKLRHGIQAGSGLHDVAHAEATMKLATDKPGTFLTNFVGASDADWLGSQL